MPLYTYRDKQTGAYSVRMVTIAERDQVPGHTRVLEFPTARLGLAENPHTMEAGVRQGLKDMENIYGRDRMQRELGRDHSLESVKQTWSA